MAQDAVGKMDDGDIGKGFEDSLRRGLGRAFFGIFRVRSHEFGPSILKAATHLEFDEGQQPEGDAEKVDEPRDLIVSLYINRVQGKRRALESMESPLGEPFVAVGKDGFFKRQPFLFTMLTARRGRSILPRPRPT
jgi:hypothetical protein